MISIVDEQQCYDLLTTTTVGRVGFLRAGRVLILPVNFVVSGRDLLLRSTPDGSLSAMAEDRAEVTFQVDHHNDLAGSGWSVLMHGPLRPVQPEEEAAISARVSPWAGDDRSAPVRFAIREISGRSVRRSSR